MESYRWELSNKRNNLSSRRHTSDIKSGVYGFTGSPNMESSSSNNNIMMENSQLTDVDEWIANEDASLEEIPLDCLCDKTDEMYHESPEIQRTKREDNSKNEHLLQNKVSFPVVSSTELRPTSEIPTPFNSVFKFGVFNVIQSKCLNDTFYENNNLVISAPTGSGKTVLMELAIIRALLNYGDNSKVIYIAPTKSLCSERVKDWENKFKPFGIICKEFTGDTNFISVSSIRNTSIIVTTPEKWDVITRRCIDSKQLMQLIKLFLIDEVHILNEKRGACLEACVSRMQTTGNNLRYIAVSATVPNLQDIATWLKAKPITFSEEYRPIKLNRFVYAFPLHEPNMFLFERKLDWKLLDMIQKHSNSKPVLIFCSTRKSVEQSCKTLLQMMDKNMIPSMREDKRKVHPACKLKNKALPGLIQRGVAFHHAGLDPSDRSQIENLYLSREIRVLATTSTLAVGVNLPAHLVIIKSTQGYQEGGLREYSDLDLLQMVGRAGRPGLDTSGSAVILTTLDMERRYNTLISGTTNIESWLHENMIEHLMSELCLGTITDIYTGLNWLRSTFLYVRVSKNPIHYRLEPGSYMSTDSILEEICAKDLELLKQHNLIEESFNKSLKPTAYGLAMDRYYIKFPTMVRLLGTENPGSVKDTLFLLSQAQEETDAVRFNAGEKPFLNTLVKNPNIRFSMERVISIPDKIFILVQCLLGGISLYNPGSNLLAIEASNILTTISRITKCVIDCSIYEKNPIKLKFAVELYQSLQAKMWSTSPYVARQIDGIGLQFAKTLAQANMISMEQLRNCDPGRIEMILKRNPPFGVKMKKNLDAIPHFILNVEQSTCLKSNQKRSSHEFINLHITIGLHNTTVNRGKYGKAYYAQFSADTSEKVLLDFRRILISKLHEGQQTFELKAEVMSPTTIISCHLKSEDFVGVDITRDIKPNVDPKNYISLAGSNLISAQANQPQRTQVRNVEYDDVLEEFEIDPRIWQEIDDISNTTLDQTPALNYSHLSVTSAANITSENMKKKPVRKKKNPDELCKHRCKNKETCAHACCKMHMISTPTDSKNGMKRVYEEDLTLDGSIQKKIKPSSEENDRERGANFSVSNSIPLHNTQPYINDLDLVKNNNLTGTIETQESQGNPDSFMDFLELNQQDIESISNFESKLATMGLNDVHQYEAQNNFPIIDDSNQTGAFSDPCDLVWQQAGEYVQKVFENGVVPTENQNNSEQESKSDAWSFQSSSLANWVQNYVDIVYDDTN